MCGLMYVSPRSGGYQQEEYTHPLADMVGHTSGLQMGLLVLSSMTLMMSIICSNRRYCSTTGHMFQHTTLAQMRAALP
jgi:hypothetical protein